MGAGPAHEATVPPGGSFLKRYIKTNKNANGDEPPTMPDPDGKGEPENARVDSEGYTIREETPKKAADCWSSSSSSGLCTGH